MQHFELNASFWICVTFVIMLLGIIATLHRKLKKAVKLHEQNMIILQETIAILLNHSAVQSDKIELNQELHAKLQLATQIIGQDIFATLQDCIEKLNANNLLKK